MITPLGALPYEISAGDRADPEVYDREGHLVGRGVLEPEVLRRLRTPLIEALVADGHVAVVEGEKDRFAWCGDASSFDRRLDRYRDGLTAACEELVVATGIASRAVEAMWGRRPAIWRFTRVFVMVPGDPDRVHRDGWYMLGAGAPDEHLNLWIPLTRADEGDGTLALAVGTHRMADQPAEVAVAHPMHSEVLVNTGNPPPAEVLAPLWRTTTFELGDAVAFRPDSVHSASANTGQNLRIAIGLHAQDARLPLSPRAGLTLDPGRDLIAVEWLTLAVLAVQPSTPWLARQAFLPRGIIGRLWTQQLDELTLSAFPVLERRGLIEPHEIQPQADEVNHRYFHATARGCSEVRQWLVGSGPVDDHLRAVRLLFAEWLGIGGSSLLTNQGGWLSGPGSW